MLRDSRGQILPGSDPRKYSCVLVCWHFDATCLLTSGAIDLSHRKAGIWIGMCVLEYCMCISNFIIMGKLGRDELGRGWENVEEDNLSSTRDFSN